VTVRDTNDSVSAVVAGISRVYSVISVATTVMASKWQQLDECSGGSSMICCCLAA